MSKKLFIGQRVRLVYVRDLAFSSLIGQQCTVTAIGPFAPGVYCGGLVTRPSDYRVDIDGCDRPGHFLSDQLEPITLHKPSQYSFRELMDKCRAGEGVAA